MTEQGSIALFSRSLRNRDHPGGRTATRTYVCERERRDAFSFFFLRFHVFCLTIWSRPSSAFTFSYPFCFYVVRRYKQSGTFWATWHTSIVRTWLFFFRGLCFEKGEKNTFPRFMSFDRRLQNNGMSLVLFSCPSLSLFFFSLYHQLKRKGPMAPQLSLRSPNKQGFLRRALSLGRKASGGLFVVNNKDIYPALNFECVPA